MLFSSMTFIFVFLPIVLLLYFVVNKKYRNLVLLISSFIFYAWGEISYLPIIFLNILINYFGAIAIEKTTNNKKACLYVVVAINLIILFYFKYFNFVIDTINYVYYLNLDFIKVALPLGISFYTFQALSYVFDVYRKQITPQKNIYKLALYICLFPQLIAGPIVKYHDVIEQIESRDVNFEKFIYGVKRFIIGLAKKVLIANTMGALVDKIFIENPESFSSPIAWLGAFAYAFQIYFDFCGYSDMALGLGSIFGFKFMENFNYPYISKSITEFWRRWHISLSTWFKEYVYIPLGGNKCTKLKTYRNLAFVFLLTGIWHGAGWNFIIWGVWYGIIIIFEKAIKLEKIQEKFKNFFWNIFWHTYSILIILIGWVIFRMEDPDRAVVYLKNMFGIIQTNNIESLSYYIDRVEIIAFVFAFLCAIPLFKNILKIKNSFIKIMVNFWLLFLFLLSVILIASGTYNPFIYFRF